MNNKFVTAKTTPSEGPFLVSSIDSVDKMLKSVSFANLDGSFAFRIEREGYSEMRLVVQAPPVMVTKYKLTAANFRINVTIEELFPDDYAAKSRGRSLEDNGFTYTVEEVQVPDTTA